MPILYFFRIFVAQFAIILKVKDKKMKKLLLTAFAFALTVSTVMAVPAKRGIKKTLTLKDGTRVEATLTGDEHVNYYKTADGRALQRRGEVYQYVNLDSLVQLHSERLTARNKARAARRRVGTAPEGGYKGQKKGLVILVQFSDVKFTYDKATFNDYFNKVGFNQDGMHGSVHDYFLEQSYGQFDLEFDVVGPVTVAQKASYYGYDQETDVSHNDRVAAMVNTLCKQVDNEVDFSQYDWDNDGTVDQVYVIFAGYGAAQGADGTIWPHEWTVRGGGSQYTTKENVKIDTYGISCELLGDGVNYKGHLDGIGTSCHEFSHCLGLPDFYDTRKDGTNFGMNAWDLMDYGCYNGNSNGHSPCGYTAYERWFAGWLTPTELNASCQIVDMPAIQDEPVAYVVYNDANANEYYLLANHQLKGFDVAASGHGMLVIHVDYDKTAWTYNTVNSVDGHERMTIIPADNSANASSLASDPFPGTRRKKELTNTSTPKATLYNENTDGTKFMNKPITDIDETAGLISFNFMGGVALDAPVVLEPTNVTENSFVANWQPVTGASNYTVSLTKTITGDDVETFAIFEEDFEKFVSSVLDPPDISSSLDEYTTLPGWTGNHLYTSKSKLRVGKNNYTGELLTPVFEAPVHDTLTVFIAPISAARLKTTSTQIRVYAPERGGYIYANIDSVPLASSEMAGLSYVLTVPWSYGSFQIGVYPESTGSGVYMDYMAAFDGNVDFSDEESSALPKKMPMFGRDAADNVLEVSQWEWYGIQSQSGAKPRKAPRVVTTTYTTTDTSYEFKDLEPARYSYKVRANTENGVSPWSDEMEVSLIDAIMAVQADSSQKLTGKVYMLDGRQLDNGHLRRGIYIRDGKKFVVK